MTLGRFRRPHPTPTTPFFFIFAACVVAGVLGGAISAVYAVEPDGSTADPAQGPPKAAPTMTAEAPPPAAVEAARLRALPPEELSRRLAKGDSVLLQGTGFDPITEPLPGFAAGRVVTGSEKTFLVQFRRDLSETEKRAFEASGARFVDYVPSHAYIVQASPSAFASMRGHALVRWADAYRGGYKLAPVLAGGGWSLDTHLDLRLLPGENAIALFDRLREIDPGLRLTSVHGDTAAGAVLRVLVPAGHMHPFVDRAVEDGAVLSAAPWFLPVIDNDNSIWVIQSYDTTNRTNYALSATMWNHGITGTGQTPGMSDTGIDDDMCYFKLSASPTDITNAQSPALPGTGSIDVTKKVAAYYVLPNATSYDGNTACNGIPESFHGTHTSGTIVGDNFATLSTPSSGGHDTGDGMAPNAHVIFQDAGSEATGCLDGLGNDFSLIWKQAYDAGVRVHSNSWGAALAGAYNTDARDIDRIMYGYEDILIFFSAGNSGPGSGTIGSPASAKNCVAVGSTTNGSAGSNALSGSSSRGPAADGRRKPDVVAPGVTIRSASGDAIHTSNNCASKTLSGTSMAAPTAAGGATLLRQYYTDGFYPTGAKAAGDVLLPSAALLKASLINGAVDIANTTQSTMFNTLTPDNNQGFGRVQLDNVAFFSTPSRDFRRTRVWDKWNATGLATGAIEEFPLQVAVDLALKVTLVWTDPEASSVASVKLVNNLDLEVVDPSNTVYRGNVFSGGQSVTGGAADVLNNVEEVYLRSPVGGTWTLRVKATAVPGAPTQPYSNRQGFALVATYGDCLSSLSAPINLSASDNGSTGINVSWNAVGGATRYQIYRANGTCAAPLESFHYLSQSTGTATVDTLAQGGFTYAYRLRAVTDCGEGALSACVSASATGNCTLRPTFGGITSAINDTATGPCDALLSWNPGTSSCPLAQGLTYNIYRSTNPYFSIGPATLLTTGVSGTSYRDTAVASNQTYYYAVRAEDSTTPNGGPANGGNIDTNTAATSVTPTSPATYPGTWSDDGGDQTARLVLESPWSVSNQQNHSGGGALAYHAGVDGTTYPPDTCVAATTPPIPLQAGQSPVLSYWARYDLEWQWDGVIVEISTNGGGLWTTLNPTPAYPSTLAQTGAPPANACGYPATQPAFTGPLPTNGTLGPWAQYQHDLTPYAGQTVLIRWRFTSDPGLEFEGFYLDDITVSKAMIPGSCGTDLRYASSAVVSDTCTGGGGGGGNGILEAGEDANVSVGLFNIGDAAATGVTATLSTTFNGVVVTRPGASFPSVSPGATGTSAAPHFGIWVSPAVACGTVVPFTVTITTAQGVYVRTFTMTVGSGSPSCSQTVCSAALPVEDGLAPGLLHLASGAAGAVNLTFAPSCHETDHTVYWGTATGHMTGVSWTQSACSFGPGGAATLNPGTPAPGGLFYFVVVPSNGANEGSYGRNSSGAERPQGSGTCHVPQLLGGTCP